MLDLAASDTAGLFMNSHFYHHYYMFEVQGRQVRPIR